MTFRGVVLCGFVLAAGFAVSCAEEPSAQVGVEESSADRAADGAEVTQASGEPVPESPGGESVAQIVVQAERVAGDSDELAEEAAAREPGPLRVVVSIPTLFWPIEDMLGDEDEIVSIVREGQSPHGIELTPEDIRAIDRADLVVVVGLELDSEVERAVENRPSARRQLVRLADVAIESGQITDDEHDHHDHEHDATCAHGDPHLWLVPAIMNVYAERIGETLEQVYRDADLWEESVMLRIGQIWGNTADQAAIADLSLSTRLDRFHGMGIVTNHSAFNRFLEPYGISEYATLQPHHDVEPTPGDIQRVVDAIREHDLPAIIAVPGGDMSSVNRVAQLTGVQVLEFDPLGNGDWPVLMDNWYITLYTALTGAPPAPEQ